MRRLGGLGPSRAECKPTQKPSARYFGLPSRFIFRFVHLNLVPRPIRPPARRLPRHPLSGSFLRSGLRDRVREVITPMVSWWEVRRRWLAARCFWTCSMTNSSSTEPRNASHWIAHPALSLSIPGNLGGSCAQGYMLAGCTAMPLHRSKSSLCSLLWL